MASVHHSLPNLLLLTHLFLCLELCVEYKLCDATKAQVEALLTWKNSLHNSSGLGSWTDLGSADACGWKGIYCNSSGAISAINIFDSGVQGTLDQFNFSAFPNLTMLDLSINSLNGSIPSTIGSLTQLEELFLAYNLLTGNIPPEIGQLKNLQFLDLSNNYITGFLPTFPSLLYQLYLSHNNLNGSIPSTISNLTKLNSLHLSNNRISGNIPPEIGQLESLQYMDLSSNCISGILPTFPYLTHLDLGNNNLNGSIPSSVGQSKQLRSLVLQSNQFSGRIPDDDTSPDRWNCGVSDELGNLHYLETLSLRTNHLFGIIPKSISRLEEIQSLDLSNNHLTGPVPHWYYTSIDNFNLSYNYLSGSIPSEISGHFILDLSYNNLTGQVERGNFQHGSYTGNPGICTDFNYSIQGLPPCSKTRSSFKKSTIVKAVIVPFACIASLATCITLILVCQKKKITAEENLGSEVLGGEAKFKFSEIVVATEDFNERHLIGKGGYGNVYKATLLTGQVLAVKQMKDTSDEDVHNWSFENEVRTLTQVRHKNIIKMQGYCYRRRRMYLIYDYVENGSLGNLLRNQDSAKEFSWERRLKTVRDLASSVAYLHHDCFPPILHRDISINNILLNTEFEPKLSDFGIARFISPDTPNVTSAIGSYGYMAPELSQAAKVTPKCDVYSFGIVTMEIILGKHPREFLYSLLSSSPSSLFMNNHQELLNSELLDDRLSPPDRQLSAALGMPIRLGMLCTSPRPDCRPTMHQVAKALSSRSKASVAELFETD